MEKRHYIIHNPVTEWILTYPGRQDNSEDISMRPPKGGCVFRYFQFSDIKFDAGWNNIEITIIALVRGGILKIDLWAVEKVIRIDPQTNQEHSSDEAIIVDGAHIGDSLQPNCQEDIRHTFKIPLHNLWGRKFRVQAVLEDCCNERRGIQTPEVIIV